jgi:Ca2+-binding EF-hand superfamily protein
LIDYFYYAQLRAQGESATGARHVPGRVPLSEVPGLCRAMGFYPTEQEAEEMVGELSRVAQAAASGAHGLQAAYNAAQGSSGQSRDDARNTVTLAMFVKAYVNHRPLYGVGREHIAEAFAALGADPVTGRLDRDALVRALESLGEPLDPETLTRAMAMLVEGGPPPVVPPGGVVEKMVPEGVTARDFAEDILGFEDYGEE